MSTSQRIAVLAVAVVILAGGFALTRGSDEEPTAGAPAATTAAETGASGAATAPPETTPTPAPAPQPRVATVRVRGGKPVGEPETISWSSGDTVRLRFRSDAPGEVHIHGYDRYVDLKAGGSATARFKADAEGVFEIEEHGTGALLAKLEIRP